MNTCCIDAHLIMVLIFVVTCACKNTVVLSVYIVEFTVQLHMSGVMVWWYPSTFEIFRMSEILQILNYKVICIDISYMFLIAGERR